MMLPQIKLIPGAIPEMFATVSETGTLTVADRYALLAASLDESLTEEERRAINRLLRAVVRGRIKLSNF
ncbi:MAG: hypothetical protein F6K24_52210 [Okeania sp. SIO2D1]|nr:hypothetical protein [Okeania sp. SIO2D1]